MTALDAQQVTLPASLKQAAVLTWHELPRVIAVSALWVLALVPVAVAVLAAPWWIVALSTVPVAMLTTGLSRYAVGVQRGQRPRIREVFGVDPVLAIGIVAILTLAERLVAAGGGLEIAGFVLAAVVAFVAPMVLAYGSVRGASGLRAIRGGAILALYRPSVALTVLSLGCIGGFIVVASAGVLALVVPVVLAVFATAVVTALLEGIDQGAAVRR